MWPMGHCLTPPRGNGLTWRVAEFSFIGSAETLFVGKTMTPSDLCDARSWSEWIFKNRSNPEQSLALNLSRDTTRLLKESVQL